MLQTPNRARVRSQDEGYTTPTSAHISRWARGNIDQRQQIIPLLLPSVKLSKSNGTWSAKPRTFQEINSSMDVLSSVQRRGMNSPRTRKNSDKGSEVTGFNIWQDEREDIENINNTASFGQTNGVKKGDRSPYILKSGWNSASKPRMGRRSITFPGTELFAPEDQRMDSPARKRVNSDRSDISATRSPLRSIQPAISTQNPPATPTPSSSQPSRPSSQSIQNSILAPPTPSRGGLRRKSKFIARQSLSRPAKSREGVEGATDTEDVEVEGVDRGVQPGPRSVARTASWMTEAGVDVEEAVASQVSVDLEPGDSSQLSQESSASQEMAAASQSTRIERRSESVVIQKTLRRSARLSAGRTSSSPRPGGPNDPFHTGHVSVESSHTVSVVTHNGPSAKVASPKSSARRRKRSSEVHAASAGSTSVTYESPNPRAKKNSRKSVLIVEIPTSVSRLVGSPMRGVVRTSEGSGEAPVTPKRVTIVKRQAPATDRPVGKSSRAGQSSSQGSTRAKPRKSLGSQLDWMAANADTSGSSTIPRKKGRKSLAPASVVKDLHTHMDHPPCPSSPGEDVLLLVGVEETLETASLRARSRTKASNTPQPRKGNSKHKGKETDYQAERKVPLVSSTSPSRQESEHAVNTPHASPSQGESQPLRVASPGLGDYDAPPRSSSPMFPQIQQYSSPDSNWRSLEFSVFADGACDSSPPPRSSPAQPRLWQIAPNMHDFAEAIALTPLKTPLSKKRKSTPHRYPIPSSTPAQSEDARSERDAEVEESFDEWVDATPVDPHDNANASEGEWAVDDRDSTPDCQDAGDSTIQKGDETQRAPSNEPAASHDSLRTAQAKPSEEESQEDHAEQPSTHEPTELLPEIGKQNIEADKPVDPDANRTESYITLRAFEIKVKVEPQNESLVAPDSQVDSVHLQAGSPLLATTVVKSALHDHRQRNNVDEPVGDLVSHTSSDGGRSADLTAIPLPVTTGTQVQIDSGCAPASETVSKASVNEQIDRTPVENSAGLPSAVSETRSSQGPSEQPAKPPVTVTNSSQTDVTKETEAELDTQDRTIIKQAINSDEDYTKIPIVISSQDPRAAALAAAVLRQSKRYVELGSSATETTNKLKRRRSQYFVSAEAASVLTPAELIKEAELELTDEDNETRQPEVRRQTAASGPTDSSFEDTAWNRNDWSILNRCYQKSIRQHKGNYKGRGNNLDDDVDIQAVIDLLVFKKGLTQAQLRDGKFNKTGLWDRIVKLHRSAQKKGGRAAPVESSLSPTERSASATIAAMEPVSPVVKKSKTSETASRITKIEVHVDKKSPEASSASSSGWWSSVSSTWRRIKSSVSLAPSQQTDEEEPANGSGDVGSSDHRKETIEHIDAVFSTTDRESSLRRLVTRPRRALPGGLNSLPIDTPVPMTCTDSGRSVTLNTGRRSHDILASHKIIEKQRSAGANNRPCASTIESLRHGGSNASPVRPIVGQRSVMGTTTTSPRVKDLVKSFEDAAHQAMSSNEGDVSCESVTSRSGGPRQAHNSDSVRRKGAAYDSSP